MSKVIPIPAIDLKDGHCVRLTQGRADQKKVYSEDPVAMARHWVEQGAKYLHIVDLDGAFQGRPVHQDVIRKIADTVQVPVQVGGGLRTDKDIESLLDCLVDRVILGTRAWENPKDLQRLVELFGDRIAVGIDARDGRVQVKGWTETTNETAVEIAQQADTMGVKTIIYTDTATDGMMAGPNVNALGEIAEAVSCSVIASGGISSAADMEALRNLEKTNLIGAIVGKALYEEKVTLGDLS